MGSEIQLVQAKPIQFEAVHITHDLLYDFSRVKDVVDWCHARYVNSTRHGTYIELVPEHTLDGEDHRVSFGWIVNVGDDKFEWLDEPEFDASFEIAHEVIVVGYPHSIGSAAGSPGVADHPIIVTESRPGGLS